MLDRYPSQYEISMAEESFNMGRANRHDIEVLRLVYPERNYAPFDPIGDIFSALGGLADGIFW